MKCETCLNRRMIVSENGIHSACCLSSVKATKCLTQQESSYIEDPNMTAKPHTAQDLFAIGHCEWIFEKADDLRDLIDDRWVREPAHKSHAKELLKTIKASVKALEEFIEEQ